MEVWPDMVDEIIETFQIEIEVLQGETEILPNGMVKIKGHVSDPVKQAMLKDFVQSLMFIKQPPITDN